MKKMLAFTLKFLMIAIPCTILFCLAFVIGSLVSYISQILAVIFTILLIIFVCMFCDVFIANVLDDCWYDLYDYSIKHNWNKNVQTFLKFLKEN